MVSVFPMRVMLKFHMQILRFKTSLLMGLYGGPKLSKFQLLIQLQIRMIVMHHNLNVSYQLKPFHNLNVHYQRKYLVEKSFGSYCITLSV